MDKVGEKKGIELDELSLKRLKKAGRWGMFIGIVGLTALATMLIAGLLAGTFLAAFSASDTSGGIPDEIIVAAAVAGGIILLSPVFFLLRFSRHIIHAGRENDGTSLTKAIRNLTLYFTYIGILLIILIAAYIAILVISGSSLSLI